jgi:hypothetical protein
MRVIAGLPRLDRQKRNKPEEAESQDILSPSRVISPDVYEQKDQPNGREVLKIPPRKRKHGHKDPGNKVPKEFTFCDAKKERQRQRCHQEAQKHLQRDMATPIPQELLKSDEVQRKIRG